MQRTIVTHSENYHQDVRLGEEIGRQYGMVSCLIYELAYFLKNRRPQYDLTVGDLDTMNRLIKELKDMRNVISEMTDYDSCSGVQIPQAL